MIGTLLFISTAGILHYFEITEFLTGIIINFIICVIAMAGIAHIIGEACEQLGNYYGPSITGIIQAAASSLPELFICIFALNSGLITLVQASLIGSILANILLLLGIAFFVGGIKHGILTFEGQSTRMISTLLLLSVSALILPTLARELHIPAGFHEQALAVVCAIVLLAVFIVHTTVMLKQEQRADSNQVYLHDSVWPKYFTIAVIIIFGLFAGITSDWFVEAIKPVITAFNISEAFAGLVIVSIAGNAVENIVAVRFAAEGKSDFAVSIIINSALQIAVALIPLLVFSSHFIGSQPFILAIPPILAIALFLSVLVVTIVTIDGNGDVVDGVALIGLYIIISTIFWWG